MDFPSIFIIAAIFVTPHVDGYVVQRGRCPITFEMHGSRCYKLIAVQATWPEAKEYCQVIGGDLAKITSASDQTIIAGLIFKNHGIVSNEQYWVDGSDMLQTRKWRWMQTHGASVPFSYTNWQPGEPNQKIENCVEVVWAWSNRWNDVDCASRRSFICQAGTQEMQFSE